MKMDRLKCFLVLVLSFLASSAWAAVPNVMYVQGRLMRGSLPATGIYEFQAQVKCGIRGLLITIPNVSVNEEGIFNLEFGSDDLRNLDFSAGEITLEVYVNRGKFVPAQAASSVPYAFNSFNLKGGTVQALGDPAVEGINSNNGSKGRLGINNDVAVKGEWGTSTYGLLGSRVVLKDMYGRIIGFNYYGAYGVADQSDTTNYGASGVSTHGYGVYGTGYTGIYADNTGGGPAVELGRGRLDMDNEEYWYSSRMFLVNIHDPFAGPGEVEFSTYDRHVGATGSALIEEGQHTRTVKNSLVDTYSLIFLTPKDQNAQAYVSDIRDGYFAVNLSSAAPRWGTRVFFLIVN